MVNTMKLPYMEIVVWLARTAISARLGTHLSRMKSRDICWSVSESRSHDQSAWVLPRLMHSDLICWRAQHWLLWSFWSLVAGWSCQTTRTFVWGSVCRAREVGWQVSLQVLQRGRCYCWSQSTCYLLPFASSCASVRRTQLLVSSCHRASQSHSAIAAARVRPRTSCNCRALTRSSSAIFERIETPSTRTEAWPCVKR